MLDGLFYTIRKNCSSVFDSEGFTKEYLVAILYTIFWLNRGLIVKKNLFYLYFYYLIFYNNCIFILTFT